ncbi:unnamed protein product, partial [Phaeothamnion confervicola]
RHTVGSAILCGSGRIYASGIIESCGYGPCAEPIALGMAISKGEKMFKTIVAVRSNGLAMSPCGNCRQLLFDYVPNLGVILQSNDTVVRATIDELLPNPHSNFRRRLAMTS